MKHSLDPSRNGAQALLMRHAERHPILEDDSVWKAELTDQGRLDAMDFGATLTDFPLGAVYSSPIPRCGDTAAHVLKGWGHAHHVITDDMQLLSAYIHDGDAAKEQFGQNDPNQLIVDHINGATPPGFHPLAEGSRRLLMWMVMRMKPGALTLFVSHDALLMPFKATYTDERYGLDNWFPFLGCASICVEDGVITVDDKKVVPD